MNESILSGNEGDYNRYDLFIHEAGQFWPRSDMFSFGQSSMITIAPGTELHVEFSIKQIDNLKTKERSCVEDNNYSATECFKKYLETKTDCRAEWSTSMSRIDSRSCFASCLTP